MKVKKIITVFLILVMVLQLMPVKQAIRYFFIDNLMVEEIVDTNKSATKNFRLLDDHHVPDIDFSASEYVLAGDIPCYHFTEMLPAIQAADIHTPPPNNRFFI